MAQESSTSKPDADPDAGAAPGADQSLLEADLRAAREQLVRHGESSESFRQVLRAIAGRLPEAQLSTDPGSPVWNTVVLNQSGAQFDAIRFRSTLDVPADMYWVFSLPDDEINWYILPVEGEMRGFQRYESEWDVIVDGADFGEENFTVFQTLPMGEIKPGQEYILWVRSNRPGARELKFAIRLSPTGEQLPTFSSEEIAKAVGAPFRYRGFEPNREGLEAALRAVRSLALRRGIGSNAFEEALRSVAPALSEIPVSSGADPADWHPVLGQVPDVPVNAVRFRNPLDEPADLHWAYAVPGDLLQWWIVPVEGHAVTSGGYRIEMDLQGEGFPLPKNNLVVFQTVPGGQLQPGGEYILWFLPRESSGSIPPLHAALKVSPAGTYDGGHSSHAIAAALGMKIPDVPDPARMRAGLLRCQQFVEEDETNSAPFLRTLQFLAPGLSEARVGTGRTQAIWNKLQLNGSGVRFAAVRFTSPLDAPADVHFAFAKGSQNLTRWQFAGADVDTLALSGEVLDVKDLTLEEIDLPERNNVVFQSILDGQVLPGTSYILWFAPVDDIPFEVHYAIRLVPTGTHKKPVSAHLVARRAGIKLPAKPAPEGSRLIEGHEDAVTSVVYSPKLELVVSGSQDGTIRLWNASAADPTGELLSEGDPVTSLAISADGSLLTVARDASRGIELWDLAERKRIGLLPGQGRVLEDMALSLDGSYLAACYGAGESAFGDAVIAVLWDLKHRQEPKSVRVPAMLTVQALAFAPDGNYVVLAGTGSERSHWGVNVLGFWNYDSGEIRTTHGPTKDGFADLALLETKQGLRILTASRSGLLSVWNEAGALLYSIAQEKQPIALAAAGENRAALAYVDGTIRLWDVLGQNVFHRWPGHSGQALAIAAVADGSWIASGGEDAAIRLWDASADSRGNFLREPITNSLGMRLVPIPPGEFLMGESESYRHPRFYERSLDNQRPQHSIVIGTPFYMGAHEVTVGQFRRFVDATGYVTTAEKSGSGGSHFPDSGGFVQKPEWTWRNPGFRQEDEHPVVQVSWEDAAAFCRWLSENEGVTYRLPTEAEWEYACRAGSTASWSSGSTVNLLEFAANVADYALRMHYEHYGTAQPWNDGYAYTSPTGRFAANSLGLFDMHGNVFEWCTDWYDPVYYQYSRTTDPIGPADGTDRVIRGGSFLHHVADSRSANRDYEKPDKAFSCIGFRVVRDVK